MDDGAQQLIRGARAVAAAGLSDAFGHVSVRLGQRSLAITPPRPLGQLTDVDAGSVVDLDLDAPELPAGVPKEAWIHIAIAVGDPATGAICRAQPRAVAAAIAAGLDIRALDGQGAMLGPRIPVHPDSRLVRDRDAGRAVAATLGDAPAIVLRGNGAVTRGPDLASAVALMWLLERSAQLALAAGPGAAALPYDEQSWWRGRSTELLPRIYDYLTSAPPASTAREGK